MIHLCHKLFVGKRCDFSVSFMLLKKYFFTFKKTKSEIAVRIIMQNNLNNNNNLEKMGLEWV